MEKFEKLSRTEMKNVKGGTLEPGCRNSLTPCSFIYTSEVGVVAVDGVCGMEVGTDCYCSGNGVSMEDNAQCGNA